MAWRIAKSLLRLREQINAAYPGRDRASDGGIGDAAHASRKSDHNPWVVHRGIGIVTAIDIDEDLNAGDLLMWIIDEIQDSRDPRVKYIIYEGQITAKGDITRWKPYTGVNAHRHHAHISVHPEAALFDDERDWDIKLDRAPQVVLPTDPPELTMNQTRPLIRRGSLETERIFFIQRRLGIKPDGVFGAKTEVAVRAFQKSKGLAPDGIVGAATWTRLLA
jgi:hypothetical protein